MFIREALWCRKHVCVEMIRKRHRIRPLPFFFFFFITDYYWQRNREVFILPPQTQSYTRGVNMRYVSARVDNTKTEDIQTQFFVSTHFTSPYTSSVLSHLWYLLCLYKTGVSKLFSKRDQIRLHQNTGDNTETGR